MKATLKTTEITYPCLMKHSSTIVLFTSGMEGTAVVGSSLHTLGKHFTNWGDSSSWTPLKAGDQVILEN